MPTATKAITADMISSPMPLAVKRKPVPKYEEDQPAPSTQRATTKPTSPILQSATTKNAHSSQPSGQVIPSPKPMPTTPPPAAPISIFPPTPLKDAIRVHRVLAVNKPRSAVMSCMDSIMPTPPSDLSQVLCEPSTEISLAKTFPSVERVADSLRKQVNATDIEGFLSLTQHFTNCTREVLATVDRLAYLRLDNEFETRRQAAIFICELFSTEVLRYTKELNLKNFIEGALILLQSVLNVMSFYIQRADDLISLGFFPMPSPDCTVVSHPSAEVKAERRKTIIDHIKGLSTDASPEDSLLDLLTSVMGIRASPIELAQAAYAQTSSCKDPARMDHAQKDILLKRLLARASQVHDMMRARNGRKNVEGAEQSDDTVSKASLEPIREDVECIGDKASERFTLLSAKTFVPSPTKTPTKIKLPRLSKPLSFFSKVSASSATLVASSRKSKTTEDSSQSIAAPSTSSTYRKYTVRHSQLTYPDPKDPALSVTMPIPTGKAWDIEVDESDVLKSVSLEAIIRMITSQPSMRLAEQETTIAEIFFYFFRIFSTPLDVFYALQDRFSESPSEILDIAQLEIWTREAACTKVRVTNTMKRWIQEFWKPEADLAIVVPLLEFLLIHVKNGTIAAPIAWQIIDVLCKFEALGEDYRPQSEDYELEQQRRVALIHPSLPTTYVTPRVNPVSMAEAYTLSFCDQADGPEEFARQLTLLSSKFVLNVDPEEAICYWREQGCKTAAEKYAMYNGAMKKSMSNVACAITAVVHLEERVNFWVQHSILEHKEKLQREEEIWFWLQVAQCCVNQRNFCIASAIFSALGSSAINRLKETIISIPPERREVYWTLWDIFIHTQNFRNYRDILEANGDQPCVPLMTVLAHDMCIAREISETGPTSPFEPINLGGYRTMLKTMKFMEQGRLPYDFKRNRDVQDYITTHLRKYNPANQATLLEELYNKSLELEARTKMDDMYQWKQGTRVEAAEKHHAAERDVQTATLRKKNSSAKELNLRRSLKKIGVVIKEDLVYMSKTPLANLTDPRPPRQATRTRPKDDS